MNVKNQNVKNWFNETINPFICDDNIKFFNHEVFCMLLAHTYLKKYQDKFSIVPSKTYCGFSTKWYSHAEVNSDISQ